LFYRFDVDWITPEPDARSWRNVKVVAMLNHTSLFEWLYAGSAPNRLLHRIATRALVPIADKTINRPIVGRFFKALAPHFTSISRAPDETWQAVLDNLDGDALVVILPEGRMMRANGLDKHGKPMTVRGGVADILRAIPEGTMLIAYCGGLHHVQVPGQRLPRLFKTLRMAFEVVDINAYKSAFGVAQNSPRFKVLVKADLEARRDRYCRPTAAKRQEPSSGSGSSGDPGEEPRS
jgi:hypothetical protein